MKRLNIVIFILIVLFTSCRQMNNSRQEPIVKIGEAMESNPYFSLSEMADDIYFVPLETTDSSLIGDFPDIAVWGNKIIVSSMDQALLVFDKNDGRFCNSIGHRGDDPEGYSTDGYGSLPFMIDNKNGTVYLKGLNDNHLLQYNMKGDLLNKIAIDKSKLNNFQNLSSSYLYISNDTIIAHNKHRQLANDPFLALFSATDGSLIDTIRHIGLYSPPPAEIQDINYMYGTYVPYGGMGVFQFNYSTNHTIKIVPSSPSVWEHDNNYYLFESFVDTIFAIKNDLLKPHLSIDMGKWHWPYERRFEKENSDQRISIDYFLENDNFIYFHFHVGLYESKDKSQSYCGFYEKQSGKTKVMKGESIIDDLYNFLPLTIRRVSSDGEFICLIQPSEIISWKEKNKKTAHSAIKSLLDVNEQDNPIVVFITQ